MTALTPIGDKLAILIPRLGSNRDGEIVATVKAIGKQLAKNGSDWHDLADRLSAPEIAADSDVPPVFADYAEAVEWLLAADDGDLSERDITFLLSMREILRRWPPKPKQAAWLRSLVEKLGGRFDG